MGTPVARGNLATSLAPPDASGYRLEAEAIVVEPGSIEPSPAHVDISLGVRKRLVGRRQRRQGAFVLDSTIRGAAAMSDHAERSPSALAHGPVKSGDIERVRRDVEQSDARVAHDKKTSAACRERELRRGTDRSRDTEE